MKKVLFFFILFFIIFIILSSCQYFRLLPQKEWEELSENEDKVIIYITGVFSDGISSSYPPCYWKVQDNKTELIELEYELGTYNNVAKSIYVINDTVYIGGYYQNGSVTNACYWINGKKYNLEVDDITLNSYVLSIKVINGIIFTSGKDNETGCFWINQKKTYLGDKTIKKSNSIFIDQISSSKHEIYIGGMNMIDEACYWKDGEIYDLPGDAIAEVNSIIVNGSNVFSAGFFTSGLNKIPVFWKNDEFFQLNTPETEGIANSLFLAEGDIYIAGKYEELGYSYSCYWKNKTFTPLPYENSTPGEASSVYVYKKDFYICGYDAEGNFPRACYWVNEDQVHLDYPNNDIDSWAYAYSIFVIPDSGK